MKRLTSPVSVLFTLTLSVMLFAGCDGFGALGPGDLFGGDDRTEATSGFRLLMTDAPFPYDLVDEANVWVDSVDIVSDDQITTLKTYDPAEQFNLLDLQNGVTTTLFDGELEPGTYSQVRLYVSSASIVLNNGDTFDLMVPSERVKVLLDSLTIEEGIDTELTIDFDVSKSFIVQGNPETAAGIKGFLFKPVVKPIGWTHSDDGGESDEYEGEGDERGDDRDGGDDGDDGENAGDDGDDDDDGEGDDEGGATEEG